MRTEHQADIEQAKRMKTDMATERREELQKAKFRREEAKANEKLARKEFSKMKAHLFAEERKAEDKARHQQFQKRVNTRKGNWRRVIRGRVNMKKEDIEYYLLRVYANEVYKNYNAHWPAGIGKLGVTFFSF